MADTLVRGQKLDLSAQTTASRLHVLVETSGSAYATVRCLGVGENEKLLEPAYLIHPPQPRGPGAAILLAPESLERTALSITLDDLPSGLHKLVIALDVETGTFSQFDQATVRVGDEQHELARFDLRDALTDDEAGRARAAVAVELYRRDGWRLAAVGQGFAGGLASLLHQFGATDAFEEARTGSSPATPPVDTTRPARPAATQTDPSSSSAPQPSQTPPSSSSAPSSTPSSAPNRPNLPTNLEDTPLGVQVAGAGAVTLFAFILLAPPLAVLVMLGAVYFVFSRLGQVLVANAQQADAQQADAQRAEAARPENERTPKDPPSSKN
ncbi:MAG: TerD family protein [Trueperaceae bacterium]|nr:TerD family protein [Trueperaceae bacterium]